MKSKLLVAISALSLIFALPLFAQGQGGGQWGGGQGGSFNAEDMQKRMVERAVEAMDTDDDGELSKEEFLEMASNERYSTWFEAAEAEDEDESGDDDAEANEEEEATADDSEESDEESDGDDLTKLHEAKFAELDADDDGNVTVTEMTDGIDFEAVFERMREQWQQGGGNWQRGGQGGQGGGRPGGGAP